MKKNYRKPLMKLHTIKYQTIMLDLSNGEGEGEEDFVKERGNDNNWDEF